MKGLETMWAAGGVTLIRVVAILLAAWLLSAILQRLIRLFRKRLIDRMSDPEQIKRAETLSRVFRYLVRVVITLITVIVVLSELGIAIAPILGAAGVVGVAVGFGAQSLVKDYLAGFLMLLENQLRQGDVVEVAGKSGLVEEITLRYVRLRDNEGNVHFVSNGLISTVTNMSRSFAYAVVDVPIAYREDVDRALQVMREAAAMLRGDPAFGPKLLDEPETVAVEKWTEAAVLLRCRVRTVALEQWNVKRELLRRVKLAFAEQGVELPSATSFALYMGGEQIQALPLPGRGGR